MTNQGEELNSDQLDETFRMAKLVGKYQEGLLFGKELDLLHQWLDKSPANIEKFNALLEPGFFAGRLQSLKEFEASSDIEFGRVSQRAGIDIGIQKKKKSRKGSISGAMIGFIAIGLAFYFYRANLLNHHSSAHIAAFTDIPPGHSKAILTLANGNQVVLDSAHNGIVAEQGRRQVLNQSAGLMYKSDGLAASELVYNKITTGRGGQYRLLLADGTKIWLDAESSIRYPIAFVGSRREVNLTGQAFFEVAHHKAPFIVHTGKTDITDMGTAFNVNSYPELFAVQTTLLEGSVKVSVGEESRVLAPGQQAIVVVGLQANNDNPNIKVVDHIDTDAVVAWKEGQFQFSGADMSAIFNTVARWYDVKVINHTNISEHLVFSVSRDVSLSVFMRALERTNHLHYRIEGKTLIVEP